MKAFDTALFCVSLLFAINFLAASQVFGDVGIYYGGFASQIQSEVQGAAPQQNETLTYPELAISAFGLLVRSLVVIILVFAYSTFLLPVFLGQLHLPIEVTAPITTIVWLSYIMGYAQYRSRNPLAGME